MHIIQRINTTIFKSLKMTSLFKLNQNSKIIFNWFIFNPHWKDCIDESDTQTTILDSASLAKPNSRTVDLEVNDYHAPASSIRGSINAMRSQEEFIW